MTKLRGTLSTASTATGQKHALPEHYQGNAVDQDVKSADPTWLVDVDPADLLVFVHIPKAAGTSLNAILWQVYGRRYVNYHRTLSPQSLRDMISRQPDRIMALGAHMPYGYHLSFEPSVEGSRQTPIFAERNCHYVTVLRDPIQRVKSYFRFVTSYPAHRLHRETKGMSPDGFFRHMRQIDNWECSNQQCHMVSSSRDFEIARDHLVTRYHAVGVVERMDDFINHLKTTLNWPDVFEVKHRNASPSQVHDDGFGQDTIDWIAESNEQDMKLYQFARDHLAPGADVPAREPADVDTHSV